MSDRPRPSDLPDREFTPQERVLIRTIEILKNIEVPNQDDVEFATLIAKEWS